MKTYKIIKLSDTQYIIVNDSEIKEYNWFYDEINHFITQCSDDGLKDYILSDKIQMSFSRSTSKKITHSTQPLDGVETISLEEVEELVNGYSVKHLIEKDIPTIWSDYGKWNGEKITSTNYNQGHQNSWLKGFKAHQQLTKDKLFTIENMRMARDYGNRNGEILWTEFIQSLLPKTEWVVRFNEQNKLELI